MPIFASVTDEYGRRGGGPGGVHRGAARGGHGRPRRGGNSSNSSSSSAGGWPYATVVEGGASGEATDVDAIADQVLSEFAKGGSFGGMEDEDYGTMVPDEALPSVLPSEERNRALEAAHRRQQIVEKSYLLQGLENPDLAETLFPAGDRIDRRTMSSAYGQVPDVRMDRIVSLSPQDRGAYPRVTRADLFDGAPEVDAYGRNTRYATRAPGFGSEGEPEVDAYGFACPVPTTRASYGAADASTSIQAPSQVPPEFFGTVGLPSTAPRAENLRYGAEVAGVSVRGYRDDSSAPGTFTEALKFGLGLGLGVSAAFVVVGTVARALR